MRPPKKLLAVLLAIWVALMIYRWFPGFFPARSPPRNNESSIDVENAVQMQRVKIQRPQFSAEQLADPVHVCITSSLFTLGGLIALVNSIDQNTQHPVFYHLVVEEKTIPNLRKWLEQTQLGHVHYEIKAFPEAWVKEKIKVRGPRHELAEPMNYARYYLPTLFPELNRIVFIDDDSIVQGEILELYRQQIKPGHWAMFAEDCVGSSKRVTRLENVYSDYIEFKNKHILDLDMNPTACSFNTGVYVTELDLWRKINITQKLEYWLELNTKEEVYGNEKGGGGSQPPMMIVFYEKYTQLDPSWHVRHLGWTTGTSYNADFLQHAKLLHWDGVFKPWGRRSQHSNIWDKYFITDPTGHFVPIRMV